MPTLPLLSGLDIVKAFEKLGWQEVRRKGSHIVLTKDGHMATLSIPNHKEVARGTLRSLIRAAELTISEFIDVL